MESAQPSPSSAPTLLFRQQFGAYFWANFLSNSGMWCHTVAAAVVAYDITQSALVVGLVSATQYVATLVLSPYAGALADRLNRQMLLFAGQLLACVSAGALAVAALLLGATGTTFLLVLLASSLFIGMGVAFTQPVMHSLVPALVRPVDLETAVAFNSLTFTMARAVGPLAGAFILARWGAEIAFGVNAASYLPLLVVALLLRPRRTASPTAHGSSIRAGLAYLRMHRKFIVWLAAVAGLNFAIDPVTTLAPTIADVRDLGPDAVGQLMGAFGLGTVLAAVLASRGTRRIGGRKVAQIGLACVALGMVSLSAVSSPTWTYISLVVAGSGFLLANVGVTTLVQRTVAEEFRGRVMALWTLAFLGVRPLASLVSGSVADIASISAALLLAAVVAIAVLVSLIATRTETDQ